MAKIRIEIDTDKDQILVVRSGKVYRNQAKNGRASCGKCEMVRKGAKTCSFREACGLICPESVFVEKKTAEESKITDYYAKTKYNGD